jgi:Dyp-type peroxidase family
MPLDFDLYKPIPQPQRFNTSLAGIQGGILRGHRRRFGIQILIKFRTEAKPDALKHFLAQIGPTLSTALQEEKERDNKRSHSLFQTFALSRQGYASLGYNSLSETFPSLSPARLNLPPALEFESEWQSLSAVWNLAADDQSLLETAFLQKSRLLDPIATYSQLPTAVNRDTNGNVVEHFGFKDSISQPQFFEKTGLPPSPEDAGPYLVLSPDPVINSDDHVGSFLVVLKIEQKVASFRAEAIRLANTLGIATPLAEAFMIGRHHDGTPLVLSPSPGSSTNDFTYDNDDDGRRCPFAAHIRKVAPRNSSILNERATRIARRGMTYGNFIPPAHSLSEAEDMGRGLLFQCVQRDISTQFETLYLRWANEPTFPSHEKGGIDPVLNATASGGPSWPMGYDVAAKAICPIQPFTRILGGEYFFLPSIKFFNP